MATSSIPSAGLPYRGTFGEVRPAALGALALPPGPMPGRDRLRPLKAWRYVGVFGPQLLLCAASVRIGPARQSFWAVWDRQTRTLHERTAIGRGRVRLSPGHLRLADGGVTVDLELAEDPGIETVCGSGTSYAWTRKQGGIRARGLVRVDDRDLSLDARAVVDDTAAYYQRHTRWHWSAGVGLATDGRELAWNLVSGVNDPAHRSERTVWIDGRATEPGPSKFDDELQGVDGLRFTAEAVRERRDNLLLIRSAYRQPFGTFAGKLPGGAELAEGYGVMEEHDAWW